ncbi:MAG: O-methyltransferase [Flavitalea sp.]
MEIISPIVQAYAERYSSSEDDLLKEVALQTNSLHAHAHMMSGHLQGKFLEIFSMICQPLNVLEIGAFTGYSALCLVKGVKDGGKLHTIEVREEEAIIAKANFDRSINREKIILHVGNALQIIPTLQEQWDLVFIDADKAGYLDYYQLVLPRLKTGGVILADNVLFHGQVLEEPVSGKNAKAIKEFNDYVLNDQRVEQVLLTIRDGLMLIRKK